MHLCQRLVHPSNNFGTGFVECPLELPSHYSGCNHSHQNAFLSVFSLSSGTEESDWGLDPVNGESVPAELLVY
jgi:hypothetical protein